MSGDGVRRWIGPLLFLSVAANLFLGGVVLGRLSFAPRDWNLAALEADSSSVEPMDTRKPSGPAPNIRVADGEGRLAARVRALPAAERQHFMAALWRNRGDLPQARRALRHAVQQVMEIIAAPTLDEAALTSALAEVRTASAHVQTSLHAALVPALAALSPESRASLAANPPRKNP